MSFLQLQGIEKYFGEHRAIKGIDLTIEKGEFVVFVGPSGCGKSTLLRLIAGLESIDGGKLSLEGRDITRLPSSKRDLAMVFQSYALYPHMSVYENMSFALKLAKAPADVIKEKVERAAQILNLTPYLQRTPKELSGGQRQRVALARALVLEPEVLLLDEPLAGMGSEESASMVEVLKRLRQTRGILLVEHDMDAVFAVADMITVMVNGQLLECGPPAQIKASVAVQQAYLGTEDSFHV